MRPRNDIGRSLTTMTVGLQQRMRYNRDLQRLWSAGEREQQFQFPFQGEIGIVPVETTFKIVFDHIFDGDPGFVRDSQLGEPIVRFGWRIITAPPGTVPYAFVSSWIQDADYNYTGANVSIGAHNPALAGSQEAALTQPFQGLFHVTFQGYGCAVDHIGDILAGSDDAAGGGPRGVAALPQFAGGGDGDLGGTSGSAGGTTGSAGGVTGSTGSGSGAGAGGAGGGSGAGGAGAGGSSSGGGGTASHAGGGGPVTSPEWAAGAAWNANLHMPKYPSGPLGGFDRWTQVATWTPGGALSHWDIPAQEGALRVASTDGRLTSKTPYEVTRGGSISYSPDSPNDIRTTFSPPFGSRIVKPTSDKGSWLWYLGDKYAARWVDPGRTADGYKVRLHFLSSPTGNDFYDLVQSVVVNMRDRSTGLAFWWGANGAGWVTDLRKLCMGPMDLSPGLKPWPIPNDLTESRDSSFTIPHNVSAQRQYELNNGADQQGNLIDDYNMKNPPLDRWTPEQQYAQYSLGIPNEVWVEIWRDGLTIHAAIYKSAPENGATPSYMSDYQLRSDDPNFGPNIGGYFGWTMSYMIDGKNSGPNPYDSAFPNAHNWPFNEPQRGIMNATLFKRG